MKKLIPTFKDYLNEEKIFESEIIVTDKDIERAKKCSSEAKALAQIKAIKDVNKLLGRGLAFIEFCDYAKDPEIWKDAAKDLGVDKKQLTAFDKGVRIIKDRELDIKNGEILRGVDTITKDIKTMYDLPPTQIMKRHRGIADKISDLCRNNIKVLNDFLKTVNHGDITGYRITTDGNYNPTLKVTLNDGSRYGTEVELRVTFEEGEMIYKDYSVNITSSSNIPKNLEKQLKGWVKVLNTEAAAQNLLGLFDLIYLRPKLWKIHYEPQKQRVAKMITKITGIENIFVNYLSHKSAEVFNSRSINRNGFVDRRCDSKHEIYRKLKEFDKKLVTWGQFGPRYPKTVKLDLERLEELDEQVKE